MVASSSAPAHITTRSQLATLLEMVEAKYVEAQEAWADVEAMKAYKAKYNDAVVVAETFKISGQFNRLCCSHHVILHSM